MTKPAISLALSAALLAATASARDLPDAFLEYVEATGAQRVLTDYRPTGDTFVQAVFTPTDVSTKGFLFRAGRGAEPPNAPEPCINFLWGAKGAASQHYDKTAYDMGKVASGCTYTLEAGNFSAALSSNGIAIGSADIGHSTFKAGGIAIGDGTSGKFQLFCYHRYAYDDFVGSYAKARLHSFRVYEREKGATVLKREFLPCLKDNVAQLYDTVTGAFFASATATPLVAGPAAGAGCFVVNRTAEVGAPAPACGVHTASAGNPLSFETTASIADASGRAVWNCTGYTVAYADGTETSGSGNALSLTYSQPFVLTWIYERTRTAQGPVVWHVAPVAAGEARTAPTGASLEHAFFQPRHALEVADAGDTILFAPGTYPLLAQLTVDKAITLTSSAGAEATILDGVSKTFRILAITAGATVEGLTMARGGGNGSNDNAEAGRGIRVAGGGLVRDCIVSNNTAGSWCRGAGVHIANGTVSRCLIANNTIGSYAGAGVGVCGENAVLEHCLVTNNVGGTGCSGGGVYMTTGLIRNCTIVANEANKAGGIQFDNSKARCIDTIVYGNRVLSDASPGAPNWAYGSLPRLTNVFSSVAVGTDTTGGLLSGNPFFADFNGGDYHLTPSSPCIDAAWGEATLATDLDGNDRVSGSAMDVGCFEFDQSQRTASFGYALDEGARRATFTATAVGFDIADAHCYWSVNGVEPTPAAHDAVGSPATIQLPYGEYSVGCSVWLGDEKIYSEVKPALFRIHPLALYVREGNATPTAPYSSWAAAATNLDEALEWATRDGAVVTVDDGTYFPAGTMRLDAAITVRSVNGPEKTILDGGLDHRVALINNNGAALLGFTLQNGRHGVDLGECGAGVNVAGGLVSNCVIRGNSVPGTQRSYGGGAVVTGGRLTGCVITNNFIDSGIAGGGGVWVTGGGVVENCLIAYNRVPFGSGGVRTRGHLRNCTITANTGRDPAYSNEYSEGSAINSIVYGNTATGAGVTNPDINAVPTKTTNVWSSAAFGVVVGGEAPLVGDPQFRNASRGDFSLKTHSPCRDAGWGTPTASAVDLAGNPRIRHKAIDIGCYEIQQDMGTLFRIQ